MIGLLLRFITPLTIAPMLACIGLSLLGSASGLAAQNWYISIRYELFGHTDVTYVILGIKFQHCCHDGTLFSVLGQLLRCSSLI